MNIEVQETGPVERKLRVEIPTADVDAAFDQAYGKLGRSARVRGFRQGHVPRAVLERTLGDRAREEVLERLVRESLPKAIEEASLTLLGEPVLRPDAQLKQGSPFVYEATVEIRPAIELKRVRGLEIERPEVPEPEEDPIERYLEELRSSHAQLIEEAEGAIAARGHVAVVDYEGTYDGRPFEGGSGQEVAVELGAGRAVSGFEEGIEGMTVGEERTFELELPAEYRVPEVAGRQVRFRVGLKGLKRKERPDLDDEFAKDVSEFDSLEALREDLRRRLGEGREHEARRLLREAAARKLIEENPFPVPPTLVERQLESRISRVISQLPGGVPPERMREIIDRGREEWRAQAEQEVRLSLLLPEIASDVGIEVSNEDVDAQLRPVAKERDVKLTQLRREYQEQGVLEGVRAALLEERVLEFVVSEATVLGG
jgi:trigger factor